MKVLHINGSPKREGSDIMHIARAFLAGMAERGAIEQALLEEIGSPMIPEDVYAQIANGEALEDLLSESE